MAYDLVIRAGLVVDGSGAKPFLADVAVKHGRIAGVAAGLGAGEAEIDRMVWIMSNTRYGELAPRY